MFDPNVLPPLTSEQEQVLSDQPITEEEPGSILRDFQTMLDALGPDGLRVSGTKHFIYTKRLPELNDRLTHPIAADYERPVQKAYPPLHGLYLLLRGTGIARVAKDGSRFRLERNEAIVNSWNDLNPTERYMGLLEAWLNRADEEAIFDDRESFFDNLYRCVQFLERVPEAGMTLETTGKQDELRYWPGFHNLALMHLFGLIELGEEGTAAGEPWRITRIDHRPFGDALLHRLAQFQYDKLSGKDEEAFWERSEKDAGRLTIEEMREHLHAYFPEWRRALQSPEAAFRAAVHVFKVELYDDCWWRMALPGHATLHALSSAILDAVTFDRDHLYRFTYKDPFGHSQAVNMPHRFAEPPYADEVRVGDVPLRMGERMSYVYDFGDHWAFVLHLEDIAPADITVDIPTVLEFHGEAPEQYPQWDEADW